jgi:uncharacterized protein (DUF488 family)
MSVGIIYTIGHSDHEPHAFVSLLKHHDIEAIADVRSSPYSKFNPQFNQDTLSGILKKNGIKYVSLGKQLGARRAERSCYIRARADYDRIAELPIFHEGLNRLREGLAKMRIAVMCAEKDPLTCHRCILVCRHLRAPSISIQHIHPDGHLESQNEVEKRLLRILSIEPELFDGGDKLEVQIERAYAEQGRKIAFQEEAECP